MGDLPKMDIFAQTMGPTFNFLGNKPLKSLEIIVVIVTYWPTMIGLFVEKLSISYRMFLGSKPFKSAQTSQIVAQVSISWADLNGLLAQVSIILGKRHMNLFVQVRFFSQF